MFGRASPCASCRLASCLPFRSLLVWLRALLDLSFPILAHSCGESMADTTKYISMCRCGEVAIELTGSPMASLHCHCTICQMWTGAPYQWLVLFPTNKTTVVKGDENIEISKTSEDLDRARCKKCTSHVYNNNKPKQAHAVPGVAIQGIRSKDRTVAEGFAPTAEMFYGTRVEDMTGGLPTFDGYPPL